MQTARQHHKAGRLREAEIIYTQILKAEPNQPNALHLLGVVAHQFQKNDVAIDLISKAVAIQPDYATAHNDLGVALQVRGRLDEARESYRKALQSNSELADAHNNLGVILDTLGQLEDAVSSFCKAIAINSNYGEAHYNYGNVLRKLGRFEKAHLSYQEAIRLKPNHADAHYNLGRTFLDLGQEEAAKSSIQRAILHKPDFADAHNDLGNILWDLGDAEDAAASFKKAITINPNHAEAHNNLGALYQAFRMFEEATASLKKALELNPNYADAYDNLANVLCDQGSVDDAVEQLDLALSFRPEIDGWKIKKSLLLPVIPSSAQDIQTRRDTLEKSVRDLRSQNLTVPDPVFNVGVTSFYLAYHGRNNRDLVEEIGKLYIDACPKLLYEAAHCRSRPNQKKNVLRIGVISYYFWEHTIGKLTRGIIQQLSRKHFEVVLFRPPRTPDSFSKIIDESADKVVTLCNQLERDQRRIEDEALDILFYPDIGMSPSTYFLAFSRLAPVQAVTWGHPDTTGIPNIDYFLSSELLEVSTAPDNYSEHLVLLRNVPTYYFRPEPPQNRYSRAQLGLPEGVRLYVCPQALFKFHPAFDEILHELQRRDPDGRLVLIDDTHDGSSKRLFLDRLSKQFPGFIRYLIFLPRMPQEKFFGLLMTADALLDIPWFSGGNSSLEAFAFNAPIVTWPTDFMRGRVTAALYKQMGLSDLIANDATSYLELTLKLAQDPGFKRRMQDKIAANHHKLFERNDTVREIETFFNSAYEAWRTGAALYKT